MEHKHVLGRPFYEKAADIIVSGHQEERLAVFNQLWSEYRKECASYDEHTHSYTATMSISSNELYAAFDIALKETTGYAVAQIVNFAKEMINHVTNETPNAASDPE